MFFGLGGLGPGGWRLFWDYSDTAGVDSTISTLSYCAISISLKEITVTTERYAACMKSTSILMDMNHVIVSHLLMHSYSYIGYKKNMPVCMADIYSVDKQKT